MTPVLLPEIAEVASLDETARGAGGFGSTGRGEGMKLKRNLAFLFFLLAGVILGLLLASAAEGIPFLSWLAFGRTVGLSTANPLVFDFAILKVAFGFEIGFNVAQIITVTLALLVYKSIAQKL